MKVALDADKEDHGLSKRMRQENRQQRTKIKDDAGGGNGTGGVHFGGKRCALEVGV